MEYGEPGIVVSCDTCMHSYFNGIDRICGCGLSKYYGMSMFNRKVKCCDRYKRSESKVKRYNMYG